MVDSDDIRVWGYLGEYLRRGGVGGIRLPLPYPLAMAGVRLARWTSRRIFRGKGKLPSLLVPCRFEARFKPLRFSNRKAREVLDWSPPLSFSECLRLTYEDPGVPTAASPGSDPPAEASRHRLRPGEPHRQQRDTMNKSGKGSLSRPSRRPGGLNDAQPAIIGYLTSSYARASDSFIRGEVAQLRALGFQVHTFSIRRPGPHELVSEEIRREHAATEYLLEAGGVRLALAWFREVFRSPRRRSPPSGSRSGRVRRA